jgi:hypothetical protein
MAQIRKISTTHRIQSLVLAFNPEIGYLFMMRSLIQPFGLLRVATAVVWSVVLGFVSYSPLLAQSHLGAEVASDTALFSSVVRAIYSGPAEDFLRVDPRPLKADPRVMAARRDNLADVPGAVLESRSAVLRRLGVPIMDAIDTPACAGALVPPEGRDVQGCPRDRQIKVAIVGLPRFGGAYAGGSVDEREQGARQGHWLVRVIEHLMGPKGSSQTISDYVFKRELNGRGWTLVKKRGLEVSD